MTQNSIRTKPVLKLIVFGDGGVGKTTLIHRFMTGNYLAMRMTVGSGFATKDVNVEGISLTLSIWDFAGEKRFRFLMPRYAQGAHGGILAFDLTRLSSFFNLNDWLEIVRENAGDIPILLVGTKSDAQRSSLTPETAAKFVREKSLTAYLETSAKDNIGVNESFEVIAYVMWTHHLEQLNIPTVFDSEIT